MAAASFNVHTLRIQGQTFVDKFVTSLGASAGKWLTADEYDALLLNFIYDSQESTYTLTKRTTGIYTYSGGVDLYLSNQITPFTGDNDVTYTVSARGLTVKSVISNGVIQTDHSSSTIDIIGVPVDFNGYMVELFGTLKSQRATELTSSVGDASFTIDNTRARIDSAIAYWQGVITSET